jgi:hypothetical protein
VKAAAPGVEKLMKALIIGLVGLSVAAPAMADLPAQVESDLRCVTILSAAAGRIPEGEQRLQMAAAVMYFVGRVDGAAPTIDLKAEIKRIMPSLLAANMSDEGKRCAAILTEKSAKLQEIGKALQEEGKAQGAK